MSDKKAGGDNKKGKGKEGTPQQQKKARLTDDNKTPSRDIDTPSFSSSSSSKAPKEPSSSQDKITSTTTTPTKSKKQKSTSARTPTTPSTSSSSSSPRTTKTPSSVPALSRSSRSDILVLDRNGPHPATVELSLPTTYALICSTAKEKFKLKNPIFVSLTSEKIDDQAHLSAFLDQSRFKNLLVFEQGEDITLAQPREFKIDITPSKNILLKAGTAEYSPASAIAEFIDNSIQAVHKHSRDDRVIQVQLKRRQGSKPERLFVWDNGSGMGLEELQRWATMGLSQADLPPTTTPTPVTSSTSSTTPGKEKEKEKSSSSSVDPQPQQPDMQAVTGLISRFGVGAKRAAFFLGSSVMVTSRLPNSAFVSEIVLSVEQLTSTGDQDWASHVKMRAPLGKEANNDHFTCVKVWPLNITGRYSPDEPMPLGADAQKEYKEAFKRSADLIKRELAHIYYYYTHYQEDQDNDRERNEVDHHMSANGTGGGGGGGVVGGEGDEDASRMDDGEEGDASSSTTKGAAATRKPREGRTYGIKFNSEFLQETTDDMESLLITSAKSTKRFDLTVPVPMKLGGGSGGSGGSTSTSSSSSLSTHVEIRCVLRYFPYVAGRETMPVPHNLLHGGDNNNNNTKSSGGGDDVPQRLRKPGVEVFWNGRLISNAHFDKLGFMKEGGKVGSSKIDEKWIQRVKGAVFLTHHFPVTHNKMHIVANDKTYSLLLEENSRPLSKAFNAWVLRCHQNYDEEVQFIGTRYDKSSNRTHCDSVTITGSLSLKKGDYVVVRQGTSRLYGRVDDLYFNGTPDVRSAEGFCTMEVVDVKDKSTKKLEYPLSKILNKVEKKAYEDVLDTQKAKYPSKIRLFEGDGVDAPGTKYVAGSRIKWISAAMYDKAMKLVDRKIIESEQISMKLSVTHSSRPDEVLYEVTGGCYATAKWSFKDINCLKKVGEYTLTFESSYPNVAPVSHVITVRPAEATSLRGEWADGGEDDDHPLGYPLPTLILRQYDEYDNVVPLDDSPENKPELSCIAYLPAAARQQDSSSSSQSSSSTKSPAKRKANAVPEEEEFALALSEPSSSSSQPSSSPSSSPGEIRISGLIPTGQLGRPAQPSTPSPSLASSSSSTSAVTNPNISQGKGRYVIRAKIGERTCETDVRLCPGDPHHLHFPDGAFPSSQEDRPSAVLEQDSVPLSAENQTVLCPFYVWVIDAYNNVYPQNYPYWGENGRRNKEKEKEKGKGKDHAGGGKGRGRGAARGRGRPKANKDDEDEAPGFYLTLASPVLHPTELKIPMQENGMFYIENALQVVQDERHDSSERGQLQFTLTHTSRSSTSEPPLFEEVKSFKILPSSFPTYLEMSHPDIGDSDERQNEEGEWTYILDAGKEVNWQVVVKSAGGGGEPSSRLSGLSGKMQCSWIGDEWVRVQPIEPEKMFFQLPPLTASASAQVQRHCVKIIVDDPNNEDGESDGDGDGDTKMKDNEENVDDAISLEFCIETKCGPPVSYSIHALKKTRDSGVRIAPLCGAPVYFEITGHDVHNNRAPLLPPDEGGEPLVEISCEDGEPEILEKECTYVDEGKTSHYMLKLVLVWVGNITVIVKDRSASSSTSSSSVIDEDQQQEEGEHEEKKANDHHHHELTSAQCVMKFTEGQPFALRINQCRTCTVIVPSGDAIQDTLRIQLCDKYGHPAKTVSGVHLEPIWTKGWTDNTTTSSSSSQSNNNNGTQQDSQQQSQQQQARLDRCEVDPFKLPKKLNISHGELLLSSGLSLSDHGAPEVGEYTLRLSAKGLAVEPAFLRVQVKQGMRIVIMPSHDETTTMDLDGQSTTSSSSSSTSSSSSSSAKNNHYFRVAAGDSMVMSIRVLDQDDTPLTRDDIPLSALTITFNDKSANASTFDPSDKTYHFHLTAPDLTGSYPVNITLKGNKLPSLAASAAVDVGPGRPHKLAIAKTKGPAHRFVPTVIPPGGSRDRHQQHTWTLTPEIRIAALDALGNLSHLSEVDVGLTITRHANNNNNENEEELERSQDELPVLCEAYRATMTRGVAKFSEICILDGVGRSGTYHLRFDVLMASGGDGDGDDEVSSTPPSDITPKFFEFLYTNTTEVLAEQADLQQRRQEVFEELQKSEMNLQNLKERSALITKKKDEFNTKSTSIKSEIVESLMSSLGVTQTFVEDNLKGTTGVAQLRALCKKEVDKLEEVKPNLRLPRAPTLSPVASEILERGNQDGPERSGILGLVSDLLCVDDPVLSALLAKYVGSAKFSSIILRDTSTFLKCKGMVEKNSGKNIGLWAIDQMNVLSETMSFPEVDAPGFQGYCYDLVSLRPKDEPLRKTLVWSLFSMTLVFDTSEHALAYRTRQKKAQKSCFNILCKDGTTVDSSGFAMVSGGSDASSSSSSSSSISFGQLPATPNKTKIDEMNRVYGLLDTFLIIQKEHSTFKKSPEFLQTTSELSEAVSTTSALREQLETITKELEGLRAANGGVGADSNNNNNDHVDDSVGDGEDEDDSAGAGGRGKGKGKGRGGHSSSSSSSSETSKRRRR